MLVRYWMTKLPKTAMENMNLAEALRLMRDNKFRRLPVLREQKVVGILADSDLYRYVEPHIVKMASLPGWIMKQLSKHVVADVMTKEPFVCDPNMPLENAGELMRKQKIGALPVLDQNKLVGIITESDILDALSKIAKLSSDADRICFRIPTQEKFVIFYKVVEICEQYGLDILTILTHPIEGDNAHLVMMRIRGDKSKDFVRELWKSNYKVLMVSEASNLP